ncbi:ribosome hibernation factor-recruiting GTPase MRF [Mycolicibacterium palauense]|uniref:ribosome hibernation factor-recruiting GTPase MRF n=1 Tax=Mycolicibacterium palauense TaxID=2034511 RepID=UPI000BFEAD4B|nr:GTP-binding protein [Mycolicibacterium palauense]
MRTPVVLVCGQRGTERVADTLMQAPGTAVISHQFDGHVVRRRVSMLRDGKPWASDWVLELARACVTTTIHDDLLVLLRRVHRRDDVQRIVVLLNAWAEPEPVCHAINHTAVRIGPGYIDGPASRDVAISAVVACIDAGAWAAQALGDDELDDQRGVAQVVVDQAESADVLVMSAPDRAAFSVLRRLAPRSRIVSAAGEVEQALAGLDAPSRCGADFDPHESLLAGQPPLDPDGDVHLIHFFATRPFHPQRLYGAVDVLLEGVVRTRGRVWLASQSDAVVWLESAGPELCVARVGRWLAAMDPPELAEADPGRRALAAMQWDRDHGDRHVTMTILASGADSDEITAVLQAALLTDAEFARPDLWVDYPDPFGAWQAEPSEPVAHRPEGCGRHHGEQP